MNSEERTNDHTILNKSTSNNMAMLTNKLISLEFRNSEEGDPEVFFENFIQYAQMLKLNNNECACNLRLCLVGEAATWLRTFSSDEKFEKLIDAFKKRWCKRNKVMNGINELADVDTEKSIDTPVFLDHMKCIALQSGIPEIVAVTNVRSKGSLK